MVKTLLISNQNYSDSAYIFNAFPGVPVNEETIANADSIWKEINNDIPPAWIKMTIEFKEGKFYLLDHWFYQGNRESIAELIGVDYVHLNGYV